MAFGDTEIDAKMALELTGADDTHEATLRTAIGTCAKAINTQLTNYGLTETTRTNLFDNLIVDLCKEVEGELKFDVA